MTSIYKLALVFTICLFSNISVVHPSTSFVSYSYFEDVEHQYSYNDLKDKLFTPIKNSELSFGFSDSVFWIKIIARLDLDKTWLIQNCYTALDKYDVFLEQDDKLKVIKTGDTRAFSSREINHPCFVVDLPHSANQTIIIRVQSSGTLRIPLNIVESTAFWQNNTLDQLTYGIIYSLILFIILHNFFVYALFGRLTQLAFIGYLSGELLFLCTLSGHASMYFWPHHPYIGNFSLIFSITFATGCGQQFVKHLGPANILPKHIKRVMDALTLFAIVSLLVFFISYKLALIMTLICMLISLTVVLVAFLLYIRSGWKPARLFLFAFVWILPGIFLYVLTTFDFIEPSWLSYQALNIGFALKAICLSFAFVFEHQYAHQEIDRQREKVVTLKSQFAQNTIKEIDKVKHALSREIHDSFAQNLIAINGQIYNLEDSGIKDNVLNKIKQCLLDIRNFAKNIYPQQLESLGLVTAIKSLFEEMLVPLNIKINYNVEDVSGMMNSNSEMQFYRIAQESLNNIVKHARAKNVSLTLKKTNNSIFMIIEDDGTSKHENVNKSGMGILNMSERAALINASFQLEKVPQGIKITLIKACQ